MIPTVKAHSGLSPPSCRPCRAHNNFEKNTVEFFQLIIDKYITFFEKLQS